MYNADITDLYSRVSVGTRVVVTSDWTTAGRISLILTIRTKCRVFARRKRAQSRR